MKKLNLLLPRHNLLEVLGYIPPSYVYIDTESQQMLLITNILPDKKYLISTSQFGIGNIEGSFKTPSGLHQIDEKIGDGAPIGRIFESREDTGINWNPELIQENLVLTRILRLRGLQAGVNMGAGIDSYERYIYIHGTAREKDIGTPLSHGCVCMKNCDVIDLFDRIKEGSFVVII